MKKLSILCVYIGLFLLVSACSIVRLPGNDPFYSSSGDWDSIRVPLIKPYEAISIGSGWNIQLHISPFDKEIYWYINLSKVEKIAVENNVIMVYTRHKQDVVEEAGQKVLYWFVIIPAEKIETGFDNEDDFLRYVREFNINNVSWESPDDLHQMFLHSGCLEWIPGCQ
jgi:hypothetical protein